MAAQSSVRRKTDTGSTPKVSQGTEERQANFVLTLEEIGNLAQEGGKPAETLMNVVALIAKRFDTDVCSVYLLEPDRANLVLAATVGLRQQCIGTLRMGFHEGLAGLVAEQVRPVAVERAQDHPRFKYFHEAGEDDYQSFVGVPLIDRSVLQGVLVVQTIEARVSARMKSRRWLKAAAQVAPVVSEARTLDRFIAPAQERLWMLARNVWWSWDYDSTSLFHDLDPVRWRELNHNPIAMLSEIPLAEVERRASEMVLHSRINYAYRRHAGIHGGRPHLGDSLCRACCGRARWRIFRRNSGCTNRFRNIRADWAFWREITSRARRIWEFRWSEWGFFTGRDTSGSGSTPAAGSKKSTWRPK